MKFFFIAHALSELLDQTIVDGEIVALTSLADKFNMLQNVVSATRRIRYFVSELIRYKGRDLTGPSLIEEIDRLLTHTVLYQIIRRVGGHLL